MNKFLKYKGYLGSIEYSEEDNLLCGEVIGVEHLIMYHGKSLTELKRDFEDAIDYHLDICDEEEIVPDITSLDLIAKWLEKNKAETLNTIKKEYYFDRVAL